MSISHPHRPVLDSLLRPVADAVQPCRCVHCATDEYLVPDNIQPRVLPGTTGRRGWDVSYWCSRCDSFYGHLADQLPVAWEVDTA